VVYLTVLTQRNFVAEFMERMPVLLVKQPISVSEPPCGVLRSNVCDSSLAVWKARS